MTALAVMKLVESGNIELDAPVRRYLPTFRTADERAAERITVRHLLAHRSGLSLFEGRKFFGVANTSEEALADGVESFSSATLGAEPGKAFCYSNANYVILGAIIEAVTGRSYEDFMERELFAPLGMRNSLASVSAAQPRDLATGHRYWFGQPVAVEDVPHSRVLVPAGWLVSTAEDMGKYLLALLRGRSPDGTENAVSDEIVSELFRPQFSEDGEEGYALGWSVRRVHGVRFISHSGAVESFHAFAALVPSENWGVAILINAEDYVSGHRPAQLARGVVDLLFGEEPPPVQGSVMPLPILLLTLLLVAQLAAAARTFYMLLKWKRLPKRRPANRWKRWGWHLALPTVACVGIATGLLVVLPRIFDMTLTGLFLFVPDAGSLAVASGAFAIGWGLVRTYLLASAFRSMPPSESASRSASSLGV